MPALTDRRRRSLDWPDLLERVRAAYAVPPGLEPFLDEVARSLGLSRTTVARVRSELVARGELAPLRRGCGRRDRVWDEGSTEPMPGDPTPAEIAERCAEVRRGWDDWRLADRSGLTVRASILREYAEVRESIVYADPRRTFHTDSRSSRDFHGRAIGACP